MNNLEKVIIIGSGPSGYTAAIYAARAELSPLLIEGQNPGGLLMLTSEVENYPGFPEGIVGPTLMQKFREQALKFNTRIISNDVTRVNFSKKPFEVWVGENVYMSASVILSTGAQTKWLGLESEKKFLGQGVSSCATCDGAFFKNAEIVVVGGGDSAMEEALFLTKFAKKVTIIHRRDTFRASKIMESRVKAHPKITCIMNTVVNEIIGNEAVTSVLIKDVMTNQEKILPAEGVFIAIGHEPNTKFLEGQIELDKKGYIVLPHPPSTRTNIAGVFASGDVCDSTYRQAITAAGSGCQAAIDAERYLESSTSHS